MRPAPWPFRSRRTSTRGRCQCSSLFVQSTRAVPPYHLPFSQATMPGSTRRPASDRARCSRHRGATQARCWARPPARSRDHFGRLHHLWPAAQHLRLSSFLPQWVSELAQQRVCCCAKQRSTALLLGNRGSDTANSDLIVQAHMHTT